ncbi:hypothetical protein BT96DRAFT_1011024 [Gymnopus androsaceus JB14]|uniref:Uncharacterized protein n=1 Tax=Gymnopus androsaceus JB14 TaxID=1447944 RepID=A0A6A4IR24_9AGAR|nr:hypothetical protein BT96DRAFT_1011024 [Gymnopus androsaceus JB14]
MMSISFGGLGLMSIRRPFSEVVGIVLGKGDIQSMLCLVVFCIVFFVLAYLTNPSENSFRAYLTELSFRQHLSRIDDNIDDDAVVSEKSAPSHLSFRTGSTTLAFDNRSPFHFANRASVSLRTPKHVFHSFGIFTIAAIIPLAKTDRALQDQPDASTISDSWFIGAFGKWWRGGVLEAWYQDVIARSGDEESLELNELNALPGLPFSTRNLPPHGLSRGSPPRLRNREKSSQRSGPLPSRSSSPPPLPNRSLIPLSSPAFVEQLTKPAPTTPTSFDQSPRVVELLHQISLSKTTLLDLRAQLNESQSAASQSHAALQTELESFRERKRQEDAAKNDVKSRTKTLEDSKRAAEGTKRDAEKKLRVAESARDDAAQRIEHLDQEIVRLQNRLADDNAFLAHCRVSKSEAEQALVAELEHKKREIKVAEDVVAALSLRARELEEKLAEKRERVHLMRAQAEAQKHEQALLPSTAIETWPSAFDLPLSTDHSRYTSGYTEPSDTVSSDGASIREEVHSSSNRPLKLTLDRISNFHGSSILSSSRPTAQAVQGYFDQPINIAGGRSVPATFSPFGDEMPLTPAVVLSPSTSSSLISSSLISSLDNVDGMSRSFQSESDVFLARDWREKNVHGRHQSLQRSEDNITSTPTTVSPTVDRLEHDPFEVRIFAPQHDRFGISKDIPLRRNNSDPFAPGYPSGDLELATVDKTHNRRWFSLSTKTKTKAKKGLNPDAKVFDITRTQAKQVVSTPMVTRRHTLVSSTTTDSNFLRAFAPSPAEREALQRALGGSSTNGSLERLPSLGSLPPSPSHIHASTVGHSSPRYIEPAQRDPAAIPSWLQSLPRIRKPNFSPWDDEESPQTAVGKGPLRS